MNILVTTSTSEAASFFFLIQQFITRCIYTVRGTDLAF